MQNLGTIGVEGGVGEVGVGVEHARGSEANVADDKIQTTDCSAGILREQNERRIYSDRADPSPCSG
jgi:hypothetical protein